MRQTSRTSRNY